MAYGPPQVVVGIEVDVPDITGWETFWPRPIQIVQWTMAGSPGHPIYLDSIRRVVDSMQVVKDWDTERKSKAKELLARLTSDDSTLKDRIKHLDDEELWTQLRNLLTVDPFDKERGGRMSLIEATGPGAFSDAVFSYLKARYGIHWSQLHNIQTATRIGEVAILPITGFAPFWKPDWQRWKGIDKGAMAVVGDITHSQAMVNHHVSLARRGSDSIRAVQLIKAVKQTFLSDLCSSREAGVQTKTILRSVSMYKSPRLLWARLIQNRSELFTVSSECKLAHGILYYSSDTFSCHHRSFLYTRFLSSAMQFFLRACLCLT